MPTAVAGVAKAAENLHSAIEVTEVVTEVIVQDGEETKNSLKFKVCAGFFIHFYKT